MESPYFFPGMDVGQAAQDGGEAVEIPSTEALLALPTPPAIPGCTMFAPGSEGYQARAKVYNARAWVPPALFAACTSPGAIRTLLEWVRDRKLPFSIRGGGHSFEGLSNSPGVVIDMRALKSIRFDKTKMAITVGAGATIGEIQTFLRSQGAALVAGTCPTVGIAGHAMGGGHGFLARAYGLACDNLRGLKLIKADGTIVTANRTSNPDLFWASRGGGGSVGIATEFIFSVYPITTVITFAQAWSLPMARAIAVVEAWQRWAPNADPGITAILKLSRVDAKTISVRCFGQSIAPQALLERDLAALDKIEPSSSRRLARKSFWEAFQQFAGSGQDPLFQKEKSDFTATLTPDGITTLIQRTMAQPSNRIAIIINAFGGAINSLAEDDTAFPHRGSDRLLLHYYSGWDDRRLTESRTNEMRAFYAGMRPYMPGKAYLNYCDRDLSNWPEAYWGQNLARLKNVKRAVDPSNLFRSAQSIPRP